MTVHQLSKAEIVNLKKVFGKTPVNLDTNTSGVFMSKDNKNSWLQTISGRRVRVIDPSPEEIFIEDIAPTIAKQCRFNGHCDIFYSVGQHCVLGSELAEKMYGVEAAREFLLHDATEAYVGDLIRPVKVVINKIAPIFGEIENGFWNAIANKFEVPESHTPECQYIDDVMVTWEKRDLLPRSEEWPNLPDIEPLNLPTIREWSWERSNNEFMIRFNNLFVHNRHYLSFIK